ncbi:MAG: glycerol-3-phosphate 1-O-acyltransferase PlsY [Azonexus sp.]|nr:glycerol-3-phosphate 1-O-acyltransferase PlsY [Betaproteobacteria bacterium]MBK8916750.1 glycerol-3-phosphate 1-O-acyltransferase PlsY [Betaproteobacteria bacterium]MBP6036672.1 glycerol-3-phosphate 1-O-acyltransferase PlsY [Azonexus sp.]MBP6907281.1 glycerol-3-phosphate 1-O-acyltransferase PlsY [Azonexus sp.]
MPAAAQLALALLAAYLLGSVPFAMVASKVFGLADPRSYGSGNPGATNVLRSGNKKAALFTLIGDALKGWVAVFAAHAAGFSETGVGLVGLAVFFGHLFPIFLKFKGGKGVATGAGVLLALDLPIGLAVLATWILVAFAFRYSSLAAVVAAAAAPLYVGLARSAGGELLVVGVLALALIGKHWGNLQRLLAGQEGKIGAKKKA